MNMNINIDVDIDIDVFGLNISPKHLKQHHKKLYNMLNKHDLLSTQEQQKSTSVDLEKVLNTSDALQSDTKTELLETIMQNRDFYSHYLLREINNDFKNIRDKISVLGLETKIINNAQKSMQQNIVPIFSQMSSSKTKINTDSLFKKSINSFISQDITPQLSKLHKLGNMKDKLNYYYYICLYVEAKNEFLKNEVLSKNYDLVEDKKNQITSIINQREHLRDHKDKIFLEKMIQNIATTIPEANWDHFIDNYVKKIARFRIKTNDSSINKLFKSKSYIDDFVSKGSNKDFFACSLEAMDDSDQILQIYSLTEIIYNVDPKYIDKISNKGAFSVDKLGLSDLLRQFQDDVSDVNALNLYKEELSLYKQGLLENNSDDSDIIIGKNIMTAHFVGKILKAIEQTKLDIDTKGELTASYKKSVLKSIGKELALFGHNSQSNTNTYGFLNLTTNTNGFNFESSFRLHPIVQMDKTMDSSDSIFIEQIKTNDISKYKAHKTGRIQKALSTKSYNIRTEIARSIDKQMGHIFTNPNMEYDLDVAKHVFKTIILQDKTYDKNLRARFIQNFFDTIKSIKIVDAWKAVDLKNYISDGKKQIIISCIQEEPAIINIMGVEITLNCNRNNLKTIFNNFISDQDGGFIMYDYCKDFHKTYTSKPPREENRSLTKIMRIKKGGHISFWNSIMTRMDDFNHYIYKLKNEIDVIDFFFNPGDHQTQNTDHENKISRFINHVIDYIVEEVLNDLETISYGGKKFLTSQQRKDGYHLKISIEDKIIGKELIRILLLEDLLGTIIKTINKQSDPKLIEKSHIPLSYFLKAKLEIKGIKQKYS